MAKTIIKTDRLRLREMKMADRDNLFAIFSNPVAMKYYPSTKNLEETVRWIIWNQNNYHKFQVGLWIVEDKLTGKFLGQCGLVPRKVGGVVEMEMGYMISPDWWGIGYATEAAKACISYGFNTHQFQQIISLIHPDNYRSIQVAEKIGMSFDKNITKDNRELMLFRKHWTTH